MSFGVRASLESVHPELVARVVIVNPGRSEMIANVNPAEEKEPL